MRRLSVAMLCGLFLWACAGVAPLDPVIDDPDAGASPDGGPVDAGSADAGAEDAGHSDAGHADAGPVDAGHADAGHPDAGHADAGHPDAGPVDAGGVGVHGGTVHLLHFGVTGDTRPAGCDQTSSYPTPIIQSIADSFEASSVDFALDLGDHMFVCNGSRHEADQQMGFFTSAVSQYSGTWFMTEGNHECHAGTCHAASTDPNYLAYMAALAPVSSKPYYTFDVQTSKGLATFVIVADNSWSAAQATWLETTLAHADTHAKYTFIAKHHPIGNTLTDEPEIDDVIAKHKYTLLLTGHVHHYRHPTEDHGRRIVLGLGGAPRDDPAQYFGYALVDQHADGHISFTLYSLATSMPQDTFNVDPN